MSTSTLPLFGHGTNMHMLANELLLRIFCHLSYTDFFNTTLVNQQWYRLSHDHSLWQHVFERDFGGLKLHHASFEQSVHDIYRIVNSLYCDEERMVWAIQQQHLPMIRALVSSNPKLANASQGTGKAVPLSLAARYGNPEMIEFLIHAGAQVNYIPDKDAPAIVEAARYGCTKNVMTLIHHQSHVNLVSPGLKYTALFRAAQSGHQRIVEILLEHGANVNSISSCFATPLYIACQENKLNIVKLLVAAGADIHFRRHYSFTCLYIAAIRGRSSIVEFLLTRDARIDECDEEGGALCDGFTHHRFISKPTPLYVACQGGHLECVKLLLNCNANTELCYNSIFTPIYIACEKGYAQIVALLCEYGANIDQLVNHGSLLHTAVERNHKNVVIQLLAYGVPIHIQHPTSGSALHIAAKKGYTDIAELLLMYGANINAVNDHNVTPLYMACKHHHLSMVKLFLHHRADKSIAKQDVDDHTQMTPLQIAIQKNFSDIVVCLMDNHLS